MAQIRFARPDDAPAIRDIYGPVVAESAASFEDVPPSTAAIRRRIEHTLDRFPWLVCEHDDIVVGFTSAHEHRSRAAYRWAVDTSVYVAESARRHGVGRGLYRALFTVLRRQGFVHAYAGTTIPNPASIGLHEAVGFEPIGTYETEGYKLGRWHDVRWYHRLLRPLSDDPADPIDLDDVIGTPAAEDALVTGESTLAF